jgi:hypothetical protein
LWGIAAPPVFYGRLFQQGNPSLLLARQLAERLRRLKHWQVGRTGQVWVHVVDGEFHEGQRALPSPGDLLAEEGVYALSSARVATEDIDGVVPIPGLDPLSPTRACYWVTGVVSDVIRPLGSDQPCGSRATAAGTWVAQEFLLVAGAARLVARTSLRRRDLLRVGERCTLVCRFEFVAGYDWSVFDLPEEWAGDWRVQQVVDGRRRQDWAFDLVAVNPATSTA